MLHRHHFLATLALAVSAIACDEGTPIDRVGDHVDRSLLDGEWYHGQTVVWTPATPVPTFVGEVSPLSRVRWEIGEHALVARRTYALDADGLPIAGSTDGEVTASFPIDKHFDIAVDPAGGRSEDDTTRPWAERQYLRVDWSQNQVAAFDFEVAGVTQQPVGYPVSDPADPDAPVIVTDEPYIDVTSMLMVTAPLGWSPEDPTSESVKIRHGFLPLDPAREYEPTPHAGLAAQAFGLATVRVNHGADAPTAYARLHNLWTDWRDDAGEAVPPSARTVRPIVYHAVGFTPERLTALEQAIADWDAILRDVVAAARGVDTYGDPVVVLETGAEARPGDLRHSTIVFQPARYTGPRLLGHAPVHADPLTGEVIAASAYLYDWVDVRTQEAIEQLQLANGDLDWKAFVDGRDLPGKPSPAIRPGGPDGLELPHGGLVGMEGLAETVKGKSQAELWPVISDRISRGVLVHEIGHNLGLLHNYGGSQDAVNYFDRYWELRTADGTVMPRWLDLVTAAERQGEIVAHAYSSVMDPMPTLIASAPGKYDRAALLFAHAAKIEAWLDTASVSHTIIADWIDRDGEVMLFYVDRPRSYHYTEWLHDMDALVWHEANRVLLDVRDAAGESLVDWQQHVVSTQGGEAFSRVPYVYCTDAEAGQAACFAGDTGADPYERVAAIIDEARTGWLARAYPRDRAEAVQDSYQVRTMPRIYGRLKLISDRYTYWLLAIGQVYDPPIVDGFIAEPSGGLGSQTLAEHDLVDFLLETVAMPDLTTYSVEPSIDPAGQLYHPPSGSASPSTILLDPALARSLFGDGSDSCTPPACLTRFGFIFDKMMALDALTDRQSQLTDQSGAPLPIGVFDLHADVVTDFMGSLLAVDYAAYAPRLYVGWPVDVIFPDYMAGEPATGGAPIDPAADGAVEFKVAHDAMTRLSTAEDRTFYERGALWHAGSPYEIPTTYGWVEYADPLTGITYRAIDFPDGRGVAQRVLARANTVLSRSRYCAAPVVCADVSDVEKDAADGEVDAYQFTLDLLVALTELASPSP